MSLIIGCTIIYSYINIRFFYLESEFSYYYFIKFYKIIVIVYMKDLGSVCRDGFLLYIFFMVVNIIRLWGVSLKGVDDGYFSFISVL